MLFRYLLSSERKRLRAIQLIDSVYYLSEYIKAVRVVGNELEVEYEGGEGEAFQARLDRYMRVSTLTRYSPQSIMQDNRASKGMTDVVNMAPSHTVGGLGLVGEAVLLEQAFDRIFREMAVRNGAALRQYPSILTWEQTNNSGYLLHFPQSIYGICEVPHEAEKLQHYREHVNEYKGASDGFVQNNLFLQPCICFHVYEELALSGNAPEELELFTAAGRCYRHEHRSRLSEVRLREFYMREIVYVGQAERVVQMRAQLMEETWALFEELGLRGYMESATDPFYYEEDNALTFFQSSNELKVELRSSINDQLDFSIASFNLCGHVLCKAFGVEAGAHEIHSGCTGFGIDRWIQTLLAVHGYSSERWPDKIKAYIGSNL